MFTWLAFNTLCALPLAIMALVVRRLPRAAPSLEHLLWMLTLIRLVLPPLPSLEVAGSTPTALPGIVSTGGPTWGDHAAAWMMRRLGNDWSTAAQRVFLALFLLLLAARFVREFRRVRAIDRGIRSAGTPPSDLSRRVRSVARRVGVAAPRVRVLRSSSGPFVWSLGRPVLVLPDARELLSETVIAHELAHIRRSDHRTSWLELAATLLHFWNPLFWVVRRHLHVSAEMACDAWVVRHYPDERRSYASALVEVVERASLGPVEPRAVHAVGMDRRGFEQRLRRILAGGSSASVPRAALLGALLLMALCLPGLGAPTLASFRASLPALPAGLDELALQDLRASALERLHENGEDGEALTRLGIACLGLGRFDEAQDAFERELELGVEVPRTLYNLACLHARAGDPALALDHLERARAEGWPVADYAPRDPDLASLRAHPRYRALVEVP